MKSSRQREPSRVGEPLSGVLARFDPEGRLRAYRVWDFWEEVVGAAIAARAVPQGLRESVLVVQVSNHTWMQELQFLKEDIRDRLNQRLGARLLTDLHFVLGRTRAPRVVVEAPAVVVAPVAVPDLPPTGSSELDEILLRIATAAARRRAVIEAPKKKRRKKT